MSSVELADVPAGKPRAQALTQTRDDDAPPTFRKDPFGWYALKSVERPRLVFCSAWFVIILLCAVGFPFFEQTESTNYDWLLGQDKVVSRSYALS